MSFNQPSAGEKVFYPHTMGSIIFWAIIRAAIVIVISLWLYEYAKWIEYGVWWMITLGAIGIVVGYPAQIQYRMYKERTRNVLSGTLCSTCKYFEPIAVLCSRYDEHVSESYIPCEGMDWEPPSSDERSERAE